MRSNRMFTVNTETKCLEAAEKKCLQTTTDDLSKLWHQRYGHLSYKGLNTLHEKKMVQSMPNFKTEKLTCADCLSGKQTRKAIPHHTSWRANNVLELVYADLCGPITPPSSSGKRYFLNIVDDFSRKGWLYLLSCKSETFEHFKKFQNLVENETGMSIKCFRSDRGGEFNSAEFNAYCEEKGIKRQLTTAYTPQQNGVAERRNRTIMNIVRSFLAAKKMPKLFWSEAAMWTCHVLNRCPTTAVEGITPQEAWSKVKPSVDHFKVWGCLAHTHVPKEKRNKLDRRSTICIFIGTCSNTKGYRMYDVEQKRVIISRDVVFEEDKRWEWGSEHKKQVDNELILDDFYAEIQPVQPPPEEDQPEFDNGDEDDNHSNSTGESADNAAGNEGNSSSTSSESNISSSSGDSPVQRRIH
ncbi:hypothetical protein LIER_40766 [Lithospermum erythrorhizon]